MLKPISDRAEVAVDFPEKTFLGSFGRSSAYDVQVDSEGAMLRLTRRSGEKRTFDVHLHWHLLADVLKGLAEALQQAPPLAEVQREPLAEATQRLASSLDRRA